MRRLTLSLLGGFVFSLPWEQSIVLPGIGSATRLLGMVALGAACLTIVAEGRVRRPGPAVSLAVAFIVVSLLSVFWTIEPELTSGRLYTYAQLLVLIWLMWEFARRDRDHEQLLLAFCLGGFVAMADALSSFARGESAYEARFAASNFDPNEFGLTLAIGIPMAWSLLVHRRGIVRLAAAAYLPLAAVTILLTGSRTAFLAGSLATTIVPLTLPKGTLRSWVMVLTILLVAASGAALAVPEYTWERLSSAGEEIAEGDFGGRWMIWAAGWQAFLDRPIVGTGAGTFEAAVEPLIGRAASHNMLLAVLVEQGVVGFLVFAALLGACAWLLFAIPPPRRRVWLVIAATWFVGTMALSWQYSKVTWLVLALIAVHAASEPGATAAWSQATRQRWPRRDHRGSRLPVPEHSPLAGRRLSHGP